MNKLRFIRRQRAANNKKKTDTKRSQADVVRGGDKCFQMNREFFRIFYARTEKVSWSSGTIAWCFIYETFVFIKVNFFFSFYEMFLIHLIYEHKLITCTYLMEIF